MKSRFVADGYTLGASPLPEIHRVPGDANRYHDGGTPERFRRGMTLLAVTYIAILIAEWVALVAMFPAGDSLSRASLWALKTAAVLAWQFFVIIANRAVVTRGENLGHLWGWANRITLARGVLLALLAGYLFVPEPRGPAAWLPASIYAIAAMADFLDGFVARKTNTRTEMGAFMDGEFDGAGILLVMAVAVQYGRIPPAFVLVGLAKPLYAAGLLAHRKLGGQIHDIPPSYMRRRLAGFQMGVTAVILYPPVAPQLALLAESLVGFPFLVGFARDFLAASGRIDTQAPAYQKWKGRLGRFLFCRLPPWLRFASLALALTRTVIAIVPGSSGLDALAMVQILSLVLIGVVKSSGVTAVATAVATAVFLAAELFAATQGRLDWAGIASTAVVLLLLILRPARKHA